MPWFLSNTEMLDTMSALANDPEKLARFKADPQGYLAKNTNLGKAEIDAILSEDSSSLVQALMSKVDDDS